MPYSITTKDGIRINNIPDDVANDSQDLKNRVQKIRASKGMALPDTIKQPVQAEKITHNQSANQHKGNLLAGALRGAGSVGATVLLPADMINQKLRGDDFWSLKDNRKRRADMDKGLETMGAETDSSLYKGGKIISEIAGTAGIGGVLAKGAQGAGAAPRAVQALKTWGMSTGPKIDGVSKVSNALLRTGAGATTSASAGLVTNPEPSHVAQNAAIGGVLGATVPVFGYTADKFRAVKDAIKSSPGTIAVKAAGDKTDDVIRALESQKSNVPGVKLTAGEASVPANSAEFAALQKASGETLAPSLFLGEKGVKGQQAAARVKAVREFGGTKETLNKAVEARRIATKPLYKAVEPSTKRVDKAPVSRLIDDVLAKSKNETAVTTPLNKIKDQLAASKTPQDLASLSKEIKRLMKTTVDGVPTYDKAVLTKLKRTLDEQIGRAEYSYAAAQSSFKKLSKPINQQRLGQDLERALIAPGTGAERSASFSNVARKAETKISKGTGKPQIDSLDAGQKKVIEAINGDFARNAKFKALASAGNKNLENRIGAPTLPPTGVFKPWLSAARSWVNKGLGTGHETAMERLAPVMADPQKLAGMMKQATPEQRRVIDSLMEQWIARTSAVKSSNIQQQGER